MGPESFENSIKNKFDNQTIKAPAGVWDNVESAVNADLVSTYQTQHATYKWTSVAALLIAAFMLGALLYPIDTVETISPTEPGYNALLSNGWKTNSFLNETSAIIISDDLNFEPISTSEKRNFIVSGLSQAVEKFDVFFISPKKTQLNVADVSHEIHRYFLAGNISRKDLNRSNKDSRMWAGVEAGAGTFNADFAGSGALSNSFNPSGLASAIGTDNFINPTTNIDQNMEEGMTTSLGIDFGMSIGKKWTLESGLAYTRMDNRGSASINVLDVYTIDNREFINSPVSNNDLIVSSASAREATIEIENSYDYEVSLNNSMQFATIPVKAGYFVLDKKVSLRVNAGLSANYLMDGDLSDPSKRILNGDQLNLYNDWSFDGIGGLEIGYSIFNHFDLTVEPNYRHSITPISNSVISPSRFVVQTGLRYTLQ